MSPKLINILLILSSFALYYLVIGPLWTGGGPIWAPEHGISSLTSLESQYKDTASSADDLSKQGEKLKSQFKAIDDATKQKMALMVPQKIDKVRLLSEVDNIANQSGVALSNVSAVDVATVDKLKGSYNISFSVKTTYTKFKEFMRNYENSLRLFTLESVNFSAPDKIDDLTDFKVILKTYYLK